MKTMKLPGLYLHIPFCQSKCFYCDFYSMVSPERKEDFVSALLQELKDETTFLGTGKPALRTIYFGGGTPSQLSTSDFERIFRVIDDCFDLTRCEEITLEANPDDLTPSYIAELCRLPFNRLSIGVQSFEDSELRNINRRHTADAAAQAILECDRQGIGNISLDLMYGLPGQTLESFGRTVARALSLPVKHISSYALSWEEGSVLYDKRQKGELHQASDEMLEACYFQLKDSLEKGGFEHYELSNFARAGFHSKHNSSYWNGTPYLGVGPGAHSFDGLVRRSNIPSLDKYLVGVRGSGAFREMEELDDRIRYNELVLTRLRCLSGMDMEELAALFGEARRDYCLSNAGRSIRNGTLALEEGKLMLTRKGLFIADTLLSDLLDV
jgi:putative oxygen-independent coproporphyrinogen III oxidase